MDKIHRDVDKNYFTIKWKYSARNYVEPFTQDKYASENCWRLCKMIIKGGLEGGRHWALFSDRGDRCLFTLLEKVTHFSFYSRDVIYQTLPDRE